MMMMVKVILWRILVSNVGECLLFVIHTHTHTCALFYLMHSTFYYSCMSHYSWIFIDTFAPAFDLVVLTVY